MKPLRRYREKQGREPRVRSACRVLGRNQPRPSPTTDIRRLTRLVFEAYQATYPASSPKVRARFRKLIEALSCKGIADGVA